MRKLTYTITATHDGEILQNYLFLQGYSRRIITKLKRSRGDILLNGEHIRMVDAIHTGDVVTVTLHEQSYIKPIEITVPIVYEDSDVIVYNKPPNMPVHPSRNHQTDTLANAFCQHMQTLGVETTFRPINRLDRDTDGLCVVAKHALAASNISVSKRYTAVCCGNVTPSIGRICAPIWRLDDFYIKRGVDERGQYAATQYEVIRSNGRYSLVSLTLETGRTHQIRVHMSHIGYPLAGDDMYGGDTTDIKRHALSCSAVAFIHPITGEDITLRVPLPADMNIIQ